MHKISKKFDTKYRKLRFFCCADLTYPTFYTYMTTPMRKLGRGVQGRKCVLVK